ncbi:hypothetical protein SELMODRAFT_134745 [Selaginella moellendorffii]|uniref:PIN domain-containing protein n=2 Tax=Selaginella moellendorffii TaxID=88036 RepID=D8T971_SELML|nr:hypothetical protein SELMODRAFT_134745 [Selaginella moellendorffii]
MAVDETRGWAAAARKDAAPPPPMPAFVPRAKSSDGVNTVVVDANALIRGISISGLKYELCTVKEVVSEVRDPRSRAQLSALPVELAILEPSPESLAKVAEFARATGDIQALSAIDLKVLALAHTLEAQVHGGDSHLRNRPPPLVRRVAKKNQEPEPPGWGSNVPNLDEWEEIAGEHEDEGDKNESHILGLKDLSLGDAQCPCPVTDQGEEDIKECMDCCSDGEVAATDLSPEEARLRSMQEEDGVFQDQGKDECNDGNSDDEINGEATTDLSQEEARLHTMQRHEASENVSEDQEEPEGEEAPSVTDGTESEQSWSVLRPLSMSSIACMTTDFAMQNVILQMGLRLLTPNGIQVRELQRWVLRCHACNTVTRDVGRLFCPKCGNGGTLSRASVSVGPNGTVIGASKRRINIRGTRYSLPLPKGGREGAAQNPILREDQLPHRILHPKKSSKAPDDDLDYISSFDDVLRPRGKESYQSSAASMRNLASQFSGRRNPNDSHYSKQRRR